MECKEVHEQMSDYLDHQIEDPKLFSAIEHHIAECVDCNKLFMNLISIDTAAQCYSDIFQRVENSKLFNVLNKAYQKEQNGDYSEALKEYEISHQWFSGIEDLQRKAKYIWQDAYNLELHINNESTDNFKIIERYIYTPIPDNEELTLSIFINDVVYFTEHIDTITLPSTEKNREQDYEAHKEGELEFHYFKAHDKPKKDKVYLAPFRQNKAPGAIFIGDSLLYVVDSNGYERLAIKLPKDPNTFLI